MNEGPTTQTMSYRSCLGCKWHEQKMRISGENPIYDHFCKNPSASIDSTLKRLFGDPGQYIGASDYTPHWCPVLRESPHADA